MISGLGSAAGGDARAVDTVRSTERKPGLKSVAVASAASATARPVVSHGRAASRAESSSAGAVQMKHPVRPGRAKGPSFADWRMRAPSLTGQVVLLL